MSSVPRTKSVKVPARTSYFSISDYVDTDEKTDYDAEKHFRSSQPRQNPTLYKSITHQDHRQHKFYKPTSNRSWVLSLFLVAIAICILLLELVNHTYPNEKDVAALPPRSLLMKPRSWAHVREEDDIGNSTTTAVPALETTPDSLTQNTPTSTPITAIISTPVPETSTTPTRDDTKVTTTPTPDDNAISTATATPPTTINVGQPNPGDQLTKTTPTTEVPNQPVSEDELTITTSTTNGPTTISNRIDVGSQVTITSQQGTGAPNPGNQITVTTSEPDQQSPARDSQITITTGGATLGEPYKDDQITVTTSKPVSQSPARDSQITVTSQQGTGAPNSADQVTITTSQQGKTGVPNPGDQITVTTSQPAIQSSPAKDSQITITTGGATLGEPYKDDQITVTSSPRVPQVSSGAQITITSNSPSNQAGQKSDTTGRIVASPNPADQISITSGTSGVGQPAPQNQLSLTSGTSGTPGVGQSVPQNQLSVSHTSTTSAAGVVVLAGVASVVSGSLIASGTAIVGTVQPAVAASVVSGSLIVSGSSILGTVQQNKELGTSAGVAAIGSITLTDSAGKPTATVAYTGDVVFTDANGKSTTISYNGDIVLTDSKGVATKTLSNAVIMTDSQGKATGTLSYADDITLTDSNGVPTKTVLYTGTTTQAATVDSTSAAAVDSKSSTAKIPEFTNWSYFLAMYLPNIIGVILQSSWLVVFVTFKLMEPFYQLASPGGASAEASLIADYLATGLSTSIFKTAADGNWVLILAGMVQLGLSLAMLFVTETMNVVATAYCKTKYSDNQPCSPVWVVRPENLRMVEVFLVACFSMIIMIIVLNRKRVSGVYSDPSRISTMADVLVHKPLIHELRDIPPMASKNSVALELRDNRYMLGTFVDNGKEQYGIVKLEVAPDHSGIFKKEPFYKAAYRQIGRFVDYITDGVNHSVPFLPDVLCLALTIILFSLVLAYFAIKAPSGKNDFNDWMNSKTTGPGLLLTVLGIMIGFLVKRKERYFRLSHSYVLLGMGPTPAHTAVTTSTYTTPFDSLYKSATSGHISLTLLSLAAIFTDVILILVPTIPFRPSQTSIVYQSSSYIVIILSAIVFLIMARETWKEYAAGHRYSDCPETLAAVLMRLCASRFVDDKNVMDLGPWKYAEGGADHDHDELQRVRYGGVDGGRKYTYGVMEGLDGMQRYMVEEDIHGRPGFLRG